MKSGKPRLVIRRTSKQTLGQIIRYVGDGDEVISQANSRELKDFGWNHSTSNIPSAYLTGLLLGQRTKPQKIPEVVVDLGRVSLVKGSRIYAALKGVLDSGLNVSCDEIVFPPEERIRGEHIAAYSKKSASIAEDFGKTKESILKHVKESGDDKGKRRN